MNAFQAIQDLDTAVATTYRPLQEFLCKLQDYQDAEGLDLPQPLYDENEGQIQVEWWGNGRFIYLTANFGRVTLTEVGSGLGGRETTGPTPRQVAACILKLKAAT